MRVEIEEASIATKAEVSSPTASGSRRSQSARVDNAIANESRDNIFNEFAVLHNPSTDERGQFLGSDRKKRLRVHAITETSKLPQVRADLFFTSCGETVFKGVHNRSPRGECKP